MKGFGLMMALAYCLIGGDVPKVEVNAPPEPDWSICEAYGVDPAFARAVAVIESGWAHNSRIARRDKNIFGMVGKRFDSVNDGVHYFCRLMCSDLYAGKTVEEIARIYCPPNARNWAVQVRAVMHRIQEDGR